jgi:putative ABC transport system permease protein
VRLSAFVYRLLLCAFPADVRRAFGDDMAQMFAMQIEQARRDGRGTGQLWIRAVADALFNGLVDRLGANERKRVSHRRSGGAKPPGSRRWRWWVHAFQQDLRYAFRVLAKQPGVTLVAILTLALGIGANSAIFSAVNAVLLRPLPYDDPDRLMTVWEKRPGEGVMDNVVAPADFVDWTKMNTTFENLAAMGTTSADLTGVGDPVRLFAGTVSPAFFDILRVRMALGRNFRPEEGVIGKHRVVILGYQVWNTRFGRDAAIVGKTLALNGIPLEVVGVLPATFEFPDESLDLWAPLALEGGSQPLSRDSHQFNVYGRLKRGVSLEQARTDMDRVGSLLEQQYPDTNRRHGAWVTPLEDRLKTPVRGSLLLLLGAVAFVLLIACVNVANLLLAKAAGRRREMAVRAAVGAGRARLAGQMLTESLVLALLGGAAGLLVAWWGINLLRELTPQGVPMLGLSHLRLEPRVVAFTGALSLFTGLLFGFLPAWHLASQDVNASLKDGGRSPGGVRRRLRVALVVSEIALASLLLVAAGLTLRSFQAVLNLPAGFQTNGTLTASVSLPYARYRAEEAVLTTFTQIEEKVRSLPGVRVVGMTNLLPLSGRDGRRGVGIEGREPTPDVPTRAHPRSVTPDYFKAVGMTVIAGRPFTTADGVNAPKVAIVNDTMARRYWPGQSPIGRRVMVGGTRDWLEVVGIVADVKHWGLDQKVNPEIYLPLPQALSWSMTLVIAADGDPASLAAALRDCLRAIDPNLPLNGVRTMEEVAAVSVASRRAGMLLLAVFGGLALVLAAAGIHGVMSHLVALRTAEIGVRMTLGATPANVMGLVLREGTTQAVIGLAIGLTGGVLLMRAFQTMLFGVAPADPLTLSVVGAGLFTTAIAACVLPARKAMRVDPVKAVRSS